METNEEEFTPRPYQIELFEKATKENTIIYLPTGSGKTYITVMVIKKMSQVIRKPWEEGGKRTFFLVNTVPLVAQQCAYIARHTDLTCNGYCGDSNVDGWDQNQWNDEFVKYQVLVMTAQILLDLLNHGFISLVRINLIIFDECHHGVGDHPMRLIMKRFEDYNVDELPRVLGTSATLLNANIKTEKVLSTVRELEVTYHGKVITVDSMTPVKGYGKPIEKCVDFEPMEETPILAKLEKIISESVEVLNAVQLKSSTVNTSSEVFQPRTKNTKLSCIFSDIREDIKTQGIYVADKAILFHMVQLEKIKKFTEENKCVSVIIYIMTQMALMRKIIEKSMGDLPEIQKMFKFSCDQLIKLFNVIRDYHQRRTTSENKFCCIIFVRRRFTAKVLYHILKTLSSIDSRFEFLTVEYVVGNSADSLRSPQEMMCLNKWSTEALVKFRTGVVNCLIATDVLDEGVDVPACSLIIRYDIPQDFRAYVQSKGRARHKDSEYIMFYCRDDASFKSRYREYCRVEQELSEQLIGKTDHRIEPLPDELKQKLYTYDIEPYKVVDASGKISVITEVSAFSVINQYCATLTKSKFVQLFPEYILHKFQTQESGEKFSVSLRFPITSPCRETIQGDIMPSITSAKRSVAVKACKILHQLGELTDRLLPRIASDIVEDISVLLENWQEEDNNQKKIVGTSGNKRSHDIFYPDVLYAAFPQSDQISYLHIIEMQPTYPQPCDSRNWKFYQLLNSKAGYAILSSKKMPQLPNFPIYMNVGPLKVSIKVNYTQITFSSMDISDLRKFHWTIFSEDVLNLIKSFMIYDNDNLDNSFLIVPVDEKWEIDWNIVREHQTVRKTRMTVSPQRAITANAEVKCVTDTDLSDWELVAPNYRSSSNMYIVTRVCDELTPGSAFPTDDYLSYCHYFYDRHALKVQDMKQPLLEVKPISGKINCIKPRSKSKSSNKRKRDDLEEHLIPELCYKVSFPALYWLKATTLPSILHRVTQLLVAEDLRREIVMEAKLGTLDTALSAEKEWQPLEAKECDNEEALESMLQFETTLDDSIISENGKSTLAPTSPDIDILSLDSRHYPWSKEQEPCDLERNIDTVQLIDIDYYCQFTKEIMLANHSMIQSKYQHRGYLTKPTVTVPSLRVLRQTEDSVGPTPVDIMTALSAKFANDVFNLERLETLGDAFLKFISSLYLFESRPSVREGHLTASKGMIIGNRHLFYCGTNKKIPGRIKVDEFEPLSNFIVPSYGAPRQIQQKVKTNNKAPNVLYEVAVPVTERFNGELSSATTTTFEKAICKWVDATNATGVEHFLGVQIVPDKTVSDAIESLTGVYLNSMGPIGATKLLQWFGVLPKTMQIQKILSGKPCSANIGNGSDAEVNQHMPWACYIENTLGYKFVDRSFLLQAFTHPSFTPNIVTNSYERLEFLGDAVIDFLITIYIYENCGDLSPGALTDLRSALVNNITFACLTVKYGLHTALLAYVPILSETIERFVKYQEERDHAVNDELLWILLEEDECNMAEYVDVPKVLGDLFESVIGAIYLDCGKDFRVVWNILYSLMHNEIHDFSKNVPKQPVRVIYETPGAHPKFLAAEIVEGTSSIMVPLEVQVFGKKKLFHGFGATKRQAKAAAAKQALKSLRRHL